MLTVVVRNKIMLTQAKQEVDVHDLVHELLHAPAEAEADLGLVHRPLDMGRDCGPRALRLVGAEPRVHVPDVVEEIVVALAVLYLVGVGGVKRVREVPRWLVVERLHPVFEDPGFP